MGEGVLNEFLPAFPAGKRASLLRKVTSEEKRQIHQKHLKTSRYTPTFWKTTTQTAHRHKRVSRKTEKDSFSSTSISLALAERAAK